MQTDSVDQSNYGMLNPEKQAQKPSQSKKTIKVAALTALTTALILTAGFVIYETQFNHSKTVSPQFNSGYTENVSTPKADVYGDLFQFWKSHHQKAYDSAQEEARRLQTFIQNYQQIMEFNSQPHQTSTVSLNQFADMTSEEFAAYLRTLNSDNPLSFLGMKDQTAEIPEFDVSALPSEVDWRTKGAITNVKNQGACGSCWAFAAAASLESLYQINGGELTSFSPQQLVDCASECSGCGGCSNLYNALEYTSKNGIESEIDYPYTTSDGSCKYDASKVVMKNSGYQLVKPQDPDQLKSALVNQPVVVGVQASGFAFQFYSGGVISSGIACGDNMDHAVTAVGYGQHKDQDTFFIKNSWGPKWGADGYVYISTNGKANGGNGVCGVLAAPVYPTA